MQKSESNGQEQRFPYFKLENTKILDDHIEAYFSFTMDKWAKDEMKKSNMIDYREKYYQEGSAPVYDKKDIVSF